MKSLLFLPVVALAVTAQTNSTANTTCTSLYSRKSAMYQALVEFFRSDTVPETTADILDETLSSLPTSWATCIGSLDPSAISTAVSTAFAGQSTCLAAAPTLLPLFETNSSSTIVSPDDSRSSWSSWLNVSDSYFQQLCSPLVASVLPCIDTAVLPPIFTQINASSCCTDMVNGFQTITGLSPESFFTNLLKLGSDVVCAMESPAFDGSSNQTCGYAWIKSFTAGVTSWRNISTLTTRIYTALQVPNDQGCAAAKGSSFTSTTGAIVSNLFTSPTVPGSCAKPADSLLTWVRAFPGLTNASWGDVRILDLLEDGKCVNGTTISKTFGREATEVYAELGLRKKDVDAGCFHLANGGLGSCTFSDATTSAWPSSPSGSSSTTPSSAKSASSPLMLSMALAWAIVAVALI
ncbi:hypothetical protein LEN26_008200 [Aphanomyces euteiches]|nr:hypothetical protein LEN26_008200 [Aphanomyces euteiches]